MTFTSCPETPFDNSTDELEDTFTLLTVHSPDQHVSSFPAQLPQGLAEPLCALSYLETLSAS